MWLTFPSVVYVRSIYAMLTAMPSLDIADIYTLRASLMYTPKTHLCESISVHNQSPRALAPKYSLDDPALK